jgi:hypothetical protein
MVAVGKRLPAYRHRGPVWRSPSPLYACMGCSSSTMAR